MRLIDADALEILEYLEEFPTGQLDKEWNEAVRCVNSYVANTPTIDAVPVVRCKDCRKLRGNGTCNVIEMICNPNDFCSYGERKEGDPS